MNSLLIEIGTEELPAGVIPQIANYIKSKMLELITPETVHVFFTPRRIAFLMQNFDNIQKEEEEIVIGPPKKACYDGENQPTKAFLRFLETNKASIEDVVEIEKKGGVYVAIKKTKVSKKPIELLVENFEDIVLSVPVPKSMRWNSSQKIKFPRPIRWVCALYNDQLINLRFGDIMASEKTYGHRFLSKEEITIKNPFEYEEKLKLNYVIPSYQERLSIVIESVEEKAKALGGSVEKVEGLYEEVTNLVEYPFVVVGQIEDKFLTLPEKVIVTVLAHHQRFFCVRGNGLLLPYFIAVSNNLPSDNRIVKGYEKVIKARLEDALFFYKEDLKIKLDSLVPKLSQVLFHPKAGSVLEKTHRLMELSEKVSKRIGLTQDRIEKVKRAAYLSKADLLTNMVKELDELQGYMGYIYAKAQGEDEEVAIAIWEQYLPDPKTTIGKILNFADKLDNIYTLLKVGEIPTGSSDPYGLRKSAQGVLTLLEKEGWNLDIGELFPIIPENFVEFLKNRLKAYLDNFSYDVVDAVLGVCSPLRVVDCISMVKSVAKLKNEEKFKGIVQAYKRISKILPKDFNDAQVREDLLLEKEELALWQKVKVLEYCCTNLIDLYALEDPIREFFDKVLVMDKDEKVKSNRLAMLLRVKKLFNNYADFSKIVYEE